jgi:hypothetical protein
MIFQSQLWEKMKSKSNHPEKSQLIVNYKINFLSSDRDQASFIVYFTAPEIFLIFNDIYLYSFVQVIDLKNSLIYED